MKELSKPFYTVREVANMFQVTDGTVRTWLKEGHLVGTKPGGLQGRWKIPAIEVRKLGNERYGA